MLNAPEQEIKDAVARQSHGAVIATGSRKSLSETFDWLLRILECQTYEEIARIYGLKQLPVARIRSLVRWLEHPSLAVPDEIFYDYGNESFPMFLRKNEQFYLGRLHRLGELKNIQPRIANKELPPPLRNPSWTPELDAQLGTMSDAALARNIGCSINAVRKRRLALQSKPSHDKGLRKQYAKPKPKPSVMPECDEFSLGGFNFKVLKPG